MKARTRAPGGAAAPLLHWLVLLGGLALLTTGRIVESDALGPICLGAVLGTATGQLFAWLRLRAWTAVFATLVVISVAASFIWNLSGSPGSLLEAYIPATACGYLSLTARGALAGFWFPAVPWSLAILEADTHDKAAIGPSWLLWVGLGGLLIATLWARETRRVAQWKTHARVDLAEPADRVVLREAPLRAEARGAWTVALGGATILTAAWIAPLLRQYEPGDGAGSRAAAETSSEPGLQPVSIAAIGAPGTWDTCCPEVQPAHAPTRRVREYITPREQTLDVPRPAPTDCVACVDGVPTSARSGRGANRTRRSAAPSKVAGPFSEVSIDSADGPPSNAGTPTYASPASRDAQEDAEQPVVARRADSESLAPRAAAPVPAPPVQAGGSPTPAAPAGPRPVAVNARPEAPSIGADDAEAPSSGHPLLEGLLALVGAAFVASLVLRPLRRWFILRHLRRPWWQESVSQRVSNLWQLAMVGLRDAGWHSGSGEPPRDLARRVDIEAMHVCAEVLDRARHGVRVDAADLAAMERAAAAAFTTARARAGVLARIASWWRSPLA